MVHTLSWMSCCVFFPIRLWGLCCWAQTCSAVQRHAFKHLFYIKYLKSEPHTYKKSLASQRSAFTTQDEACLLSGCLWSTPTPLAVRHSPLVSGEEESYGVILLSVALCWTSWRVPELYLWQCDVWRKFLEWRSADTEQPMPVPLNPILGPHPNCLQGIVLTCAGFQTLHGSCSVEYQAAWPKLCWMLVWQFKNIDKYAPVFKNIPWYCGI